MPANAPLPGILIADFDSVRQGEIWDETRGSELDGARARFSSFLRFVHTIGADVTLPAPMLLDGVFFLWLGPEGIRQVLAVDRGIRLPLDVTCTDGALRDWYESRMADSNFEWSSTRRLLAAGWSRDAIDERRLEWLREYDDGMLPLRTVSAPFPFREEIAKLDSLVGLEELCDRLREVERRSTAKQVIESSGGTPEDRRELFRWWSWAYASALAAQHGAEWVEFTPSERVVESSQKATGGSRLRIEGSLVRDLGTMSSHRYAGVLDAAEGARREWLRGRRHWALRTLSMHMAERQASPRTWIGVVARTGIWALTLALLAAFSIASAVFPAVGWLLVVPVLGVVITDFPWPQLAALVERRPGHLDALVYLRRV